MHYMHLSEFERRQTSDDLCKMLGFCSNIIILTVTSFLFWSSKGGDFARASSYSNCLTPNGVSGHCRNLRECEPLYQLLIRNKPRPPTYVIDFLRRSHCGFEGNDPVVCCPKPKESQGRGKSNEHEPVSSENFNKSCGSIKIISDKIIGGSLTTLYEFPWMALIGYNTKYGLQYRCGGTLISSRYVLTAAHCVALTTISPVVVRLGEYNLESQEDCETGRGCAPPVKDVMIEEMIPHPNYSKPQLFNDIALIKLSEPVNTSESIRPICLPLEKNISERSFMRDKAVVTGWGTTKTGIRSQILLKATLPIVPRTDCSKIYRKEVSITESQICAGGEADRDSCSGDSGGPLQVIGVNPLGEPAYIQHGIVSFGPRHCGTKGIPGVYTKVSHYVDWILTNMKEN